MPYAPLLISLHRKGRRRGVLVAAVFGVGALVEALYVVRVGGDFMDNRFLMPALFLLLAPVAVVPATRRFAWALVVVPWAIVALAVLRGPEDGVPRAFGTGTPNPITTVDFGVAPGGSERPPFTGKGVYYLKHRLPGTPSAHEPRARDLRSRAHPATRSDPTPTFSTCSVSATPMTSHLELERAAQPSRTRSRSRDRGSRLAC